MTRNNASVSLSDSWNIGRFIIESLFFQEYFVNFRILPFRFHH